MDRTIFGKNIFKLDSIASTQTVLRERYDEGDREGLIVVANEQTLGRGRHQRAWYSPAGKGLWMSVLVQPTGPEDLWTWTSLWAGIVVHNALFKLLGDEQTLATILLKWPNDLMWGSRKLGGIIAERVGNNNENPAIAIGIGINLLQDEGDYPPHLRGEAISLREITGERFAPDTALEAVILSLEEMIPLLKPVDPQRIQKVWLSSAWAFDEKLQISSGERIFEGLFVGLGKYGELGLRTAQGEIQYITSSDSIQKVN